MRRVSSRISGVRRDYSWAEALHLRHSGDLRVIPGTDIRPQAPIVSIVVVTPRQTQTSPRDPSRHRTARLMHSTRQPCVVITVTYVSNIYKK